MAEHDPHGRRGKIACPSARARPGAEMFGAVQADGTTSFFGKPLPVRRDFVRAVRGGRAPESRFRFTSPCQGCGCSQWSDGRCTVIDRLGQARDQAEPSELPDCPIRPQCRWFRQEGAAACGICPLVVTTP